MSDLLCGEPTMISVSELEAMLRAVPGVTSVSNNPRGRLPQAEAQQLWRHVQVAAGRRCSSDKKVGVHEPDAADARPTLAHALIAAIDNACKELGLQVHEGLVRPAPPSQAELEWLHGVV